MNRLDFKTVKKHTSVGNYTISVPLDYFNDYLEKQINKGGLQLNPDFQRGHVWTEDQQIKYVEFVLRSQDTSISQPIYLNHQNWMTTYEGDYVCVDGLQRLTALKKFIDGDLRVFGGYTINEIDNLNLSTKSIYVCVNNLKTREEVLNWYIELNSGGTIHSEEEIDRVKQLLNLERKK